MRLTIALGLLMGINLCGISARSVVGAGPPPATLQWSRTISTRLNDWSRSVSADGLGNVYMAGPYRNNPDPAEVLATFVSRFTDAGTHQWTRQLNSPETDETTGVAADALGNIFFVGETYGSLGGPHAGASDAYIGKYDVSGSLRWLRQFGSSGDERAGAVAVDGLGNAYVTGAANSGAFVHKYDGDGNLIWSQLIQTSQSQTGRGISVDDLGNVFVTGNAVDFGSNGVGEIDAFVSKLGADGSLAWTREFGGPGADNGSAIAGDGWGNVYFAGTANSNLTGAPDAGGGFIGKYDGEGNLQWLRQLSSANGSIANGVSADRAGNIYMSGMTFGQLDGAVTGSGGVFLSKYDPHGNVIWTRQFGSWFDQGWALATDGRGAIYVSGSGNSAASTDPILFKLVDPGFLIPEPSGALPGLSALVLSLSLGRPRRIDRR